MEFKENEKYTEDMLKYFGDDEFILINSILSKIDKIIKERHHTRYFSDE